MLDPESNPQSLPVYLQKFRPRALSGVSRVMGVGFTLIASYKLIKIEPRYSSGSDLQVIKRIHRIGQTKNRTIWKPITQDSPDDLTVLRLTEKKELSIA